MPIGTSCERFDKRSSRSTSLWHCQWFGDWFCYCLGRRPCQWKRWLGKGIGIQDHILGIEMDVGKAKMFLTSIE